MGLPGFDEMVEHREREDRVEARTPVDKLEEVALHDLVLEELCPA